MTEYKNNYYKRMSKMYLCTIPLFILIGVVIHPLYLIAIPFSIVMSLIMHSEGD